MTKRKTVLAKGLLTDADVAKFERAVQKWQTLLNLGDWRIERSPKPARKSVMAEVVRREFEHRLASYRVNRDWGEASINDQCIEEIACHEVCHVFLYELIEFVGTPSANVADKDAAEHRVINTLVRLLVPGADMRAVRKTLEAK